MKHQLTTYLKVLLLALLLSFGLSYALAWTSPTQTPPNGNVAAPINEGTTDQTKTGGITASSFTTTGLVPTANTVKADAFTTTGLTTTGTLRVTTGAGAAKVLTSDAAGNATWQTPATGADNLGNHVATQALNLNGNNITNAGTVNTGRINASEAAGAYSYISMADDTSTGGAKFIHANSDVIGFLKGGGASWLSYWTDAGNQINTGTVTATDVYISSKTKWVSSLVGTTNVYSCPNTYDPNCPGLTTCSGNLSLSSTCSYTGYNFGFNGCYNALSANCTLVGKLQP